MLKKAYVRFLLWALAPVLRAEPVDYSKEIGPANGGWRLRRDGRPLSVR